MTERVLQDIQSNPTAQHRGEADALNYVLGASVAHATSLGRSVFASIDVEQVFSAVELLAERRTLEVAPFVANWAPEVERFDRPRWPSSFGSNLAQALLTGNNHAIEKLLREAIQAELGEGSGNVYRGLLDHMIMALRRVVNIQDATSVLYLKPILDLANTLGLLTVATLNYDRSVEIACAAAGIPVSTGLIPGAELAQIVRPESGISLLKLHGSIDWWLEASYPTVLPGGSLRETTVGISEDPLNDRRSPGVVFGQRGKLRAQGPFLELLAEFAHGLAAADDLLVVGYSFRDDHVNELVRRWINGDPRRHITVIDPGFPEKRGWMEQDFRHEMLYGLIPLDQPTQMQPYFEPRLTVEREPASTGLAKVFARFT